MKLQRIFFRSLAVGTAVCLACLCLAGCGQQVARIGETTGRLSGLAPADSLSGEYLKSYQDFTASLFKSLYSETSQGDGVFISPASLYMALGMTAEGMQGNTLSQTLSLLGGESMDVLRQGNRSLQSLLVGNPEENYQLSNAIWIRDIYKEVIKPSFIEANTGYYGALLSPHSFNNTLVPTINRWVRDNTDGLIKNLLEPSQITDDSFMVLINTLMFEAKWATPFDTDHSFEGTFKGQKGDISLTYMRGSFVLPWYEDETVSAALLPYADERTAMLVAVPKDGESLASLMDTFTGETLSSWMMEMKEEAAEITLPRFTMSYKKDLSGTLTALGMKDAFDAKKADFTAMIDKGKASPFIGSVIHQTVLQVGEKGTKAAAATSGIMNDSAAQGNRLTADRPFLCAILDKPTGAVIFLGAVNNPQPFEP